MAMEQATTDLGALAVPERSQAGALVGYDATAVVEMAEGGEVFGQDLRLPALVLLQGNTPNMPQGANPGQLWDTVTGETLDAVWLVPVRVKAQRRMFAPGSVYSSERRPWCWSSDGSVPDHGAALVNPCGKCSFAKDDAVYSLVVLRVDGEGNSIGLYLMRLGRAGAGAVAILASGVNLRQRVVEVASERVTTKRGTFHAWRARPVGGVALSETAALDIDAAWQRWRSVVIPVWSPEDDETAQEGAVVPEPVQAQAPVAAAPVPAAPRPAQGAGQVRTAPPVPTATPGVMATPGGRKRCDAHGIYLARDAKGNWGHWINVGQKNAQWCAGSVASTAAPAPAPSPAPTAQDVLIGSNELPF